MPHKFVDLGITEKQDFDLESPSKPTNKKVFPSMQSHNFFRILTLIYFLTVSP